MSQEQNNWIFGCLIIVLIIAVAIIPFEPARGIYLTIFSLLMIGAAYFRATKKRITPTDSQTRSTVGAEELPSAVKQELSSEAELVQVRVFDKDSIILQPSSKPSQPESATVQSPSRMPEDKLRQEIDKLEKRIHSLQQQITEEPFGDFVTLTPVEKGSEPTSSEISSDDLELSELAVEHILEALEDKLAKGAISRALYDRLRDKYIARMEKAKERHKAPRGTKEPLTGE